MSRSSFRRLTEYLHLNNNTTQGSVGSPDLDQNIEVNGIYACSTINTNRKGFPHELKNPTFSGRGDTEQLQHDNLVATAWKDAEPVHIVSTTSDPLGDGPTHRRVPWGEVILIQRSPAVVAYQENYYGVDRAMQYRSKCPVGRQSRRCWKFFMNFILWKMTPGVMKPRTHYSLCDLHVDVAMSLIEDFSNRKQPRHLGKQLITAAGLSEHHSMKLKRPRGRCKWCAKEGKMKGVVYGCDKCMLHLCQGACFQAYHVHNQLPVL
ncbi:piggyBac transposable element-derived protein 4-like [Crassostrea angulata]|uniref:piggyBac transposable element-derived protein 4-like n=1 Tax=Magallana angulata TaxID=2784310 RepID=UPI0022B1355E|nr:piggyBac transposable element-derived protein 4-like [Crassostrea angulata]